MIEIRRVQDSDRTLIFKWRNLDFNRVKMINSEIISWAEHCEWWNHKQQDKDFLSLVLTYGDDDISIINFFNKDNRIFWGFYLTDIGAKNPWPSLIQTETAALQFFKTDFTGDELFCETLLSNTAVWLLHKRFGFSDIKKQTDTNTLLQSVKRNEISI